MGNHHHPHRAPHAEIVFGEGEANPDFTFSEEESETAQEIVFSPEEATRGLEGIPPAAPAAAPRPAAAVAPSSPRDPVQGGDDSSAPPSSTDRILQDAAAAPGVAGEYLGARGSVPAAEAPLHFTSPAHDPVLPRHLELPASPEAPAVPTRAPILPGILSLASGGYNYVQGLRGLYGAHREGQDRNVNAGAQTTSGLLGMMQGIMSFGGSQTEGATTGLGVAQTAVEGAQGIYNLARSFTAHNRPNQNAEEVEQQRIDGANQVMHAYLGALNNPNAGNPLIGVAGQVGLTTGQAIVNHTDAYAQQQHLYGQDPYAHASQRAVDTSGAPVRYASGSDAAANAGARTFTNVHNSVYNLTNNETVSTIAGGVVGGAHAAGRGIVNSAYGAGHEVSSLAGRGARFARNLLPW